LRPCPPGCEPDGRTHETSESEVDEECGWEGGEEGGEGGVGGNEVMEGGELTGRQGEEKGGEEGEEVGILNGTRWGLEGDAFNHSPPYHHLHTQTHPIHPTPPPQSSFSINHSTHRNTP